MSSDESSRMTSRSRRAKKFLTPSMKYEIWLQLIRGEATIAHAAAAAAVDRSTIIRVRQAGPAWLVDQLRARRRGEHVPSPRVRAALIAWRDARRTVARAQR